MPTKRTRRSRNRRADEVRAWADLFTTGRDYFGDLTPLGFPGGDGDRAARDAAGQAWARLGAAFMATWRPTSTRQTPWALDRFGEPRD